MYTYQYCRLFGGGLLTLAGSAAALAPDGQWKILGLIGAAVFFVSGVGFLIMAQLMKHDLNNSQQGPR